MDYSLLLHPAASSSSPFSFLSSLPPLTRRLCLQHASFSSVSAHTQLVHEDEHPRYMYAVLQGSLSLFVRGEEGDEVCVGAVRRGESVGAIGMLYGSDDMYSRRYKGDRDRDRNNEHAAAGQEDRPPAPLSPAAAQLQPGSGSKRSSFAARSSLSPSSVALPPPPALPVSVLLSSQVHRYGVTAITNVQTDVAVFDLSALQLLLAPSTGWQPSFQQLFPFVQRLPLLLPCSHYRLMQLLHVARLMHFQRGECVELQGGESEGLHVIVSGEVELVRELEAEGGGKARDVVLGRLGEGEVIGDGCAQSDAWLPYASVRAACRVSTLFISRQLLSALLPRTLWKQLRDSHRRRLEHYQQRVAHTLSLIRRHVPVVERARSRCKKSPLLALTEQRNKDDRREGLKAREHKRSKGDEEAPAVVMSSEAPKGDGAADDSDWGGMQDLHVCFQQLMRGRDASESNVTRHFGVRKRWRWAISAVVYLSRIGMAFLVRDRSSKGETEEDSSIDATFAAYTKTGKVNQPSLLHNRIQRRSSIHARLSQHSRQSIDTTYTAPRTPRSGSAGRRSSTSSTPGSRSHYAHHRSVSVNMRELERLDSKMAHVRDVEEREQRTEEDKRQIAQRMAQVEEEAEAEERDEAAQEQASSTFLTATDDVEQEAEGRALSPALRPLLTLDKALMDMQRVQATDEERLHMEAATARMTEDDMTSLAYMRRHSHRQRHFRASSASLLVKHTAQLAQHAARDGTEAQLEDETRRAQLAVASLWASISQRAQTALPIRKHALLLPAPAMEEQPTFKAITTTPPRDAAPEMPAGECCLRLSSLTAADGSAGVRKPARYFPDLFVSLFPSSAVSLRSVHLSPASSFHYLHISSPALSAAAVHSMVRDALLPAFPSLVSLLVDVASLGSGQLRCLWMRGGGQQVESEKRRGQEAALLANRDELVRQLREMSRARRWTSDDVTPDETQKKNANREEEEKQSISGHYQQPHHQPPQRTQQAPTNRELPPLRSARHASSHQPTPPPPAWQSPFSHTQHSKLASHQRELQRQAHTQARERGEGQGEPELSRRGGVAAGDVVVLGGGVVHGRRRLKGAEAALVRFEREKRRLWRAQGVVADEQQRHVDSTSSAATQP